MKTLLFHSKPAAAGVRAARPSVRSGSVLVIVLWVAFGLVSMALYFAHTMTFELRAADNRVAAMEAEQAIAGAIRYVSNILVTAQYPGTLPDPQTYRRDAISVGDATFWLIGRTETQSSSREEVYFNLVDEGSKLDLNTATIDMMLYLSRMTSPLAAAIVDWRDTDSEPGDGGAEDEIYQRLNPAYRCKNARFESVDELRLVYGLDLELLYGEDANLNGVLDPNENDADQSYPQDNRDGLLDPGLVEYFTVYGQQPTTRTNGEARINIAAGGTNQTALATLLAEKFDTDKANEILSQIRVASGGGGTGTNRPGGGGGGTGTTTTTVGSLLEFYIRSGMNASDFAQIETDITASTNSTAGLVNVNTASEAVLRCIPGIGLDYASTLVAYRQNNQSSLIANPSLAWVADLLGQTNAIQAGPYLTGHSYQFTADIAAVGHFGRGFRRARVIFDTSEGTPRVVFRQDVTHLGWPLGKEVRTALRLSAKNRP